VFGDAACRCGSKELHEEVDEFVVVPQWEGVDQGDAQCMSRHFLIIHAMFDDFFDFMPLFFGLSRLFQDFVIADVDQVVDRTLLRFGRARFNPA